MHACMYAREERERVMEREQSKANKFLAQVYMNVESARAREKRESNREKARARARARE